MPHATGIEHGSEVVYFAGTCLASFHSRLSNSHTDNAATSALQAKQTLKNLKADTASVKFRKEQRAMVQVGSPVDMREAKAMIWSGLRGFRH